MLTHEDVIFLCRLHGRRAAMLGLQRPKSAPVPAPAPVATTPPAPVPDAEWRD